MSVKLFLKFCDFSGKYHLSIKIDNELCLICELWCQNAHGKSPKKVCNS